MMAHLLEAIQRTGMRRVLFVGNQVIVVPLSGLLLPFPVMLLFVIL
jgi:hypothetical protein